MTSAAERHQRRRLTKPAWPLNPCATIRATRGRVTLPLLGPTAVTWTPVAVRATQTGVTRRMGSLSRVRQWPA
jgi:hypothetical protein